MKCIVVGHTKGLGLAIYNHFKEMGWDVIGMSRSNGYAVPDDIKRIVDEATGCDLAVLCSHADGKQIDLVDNLKDKVSKIAVCGSISRLEPFDDFIEPCYVKQKQQLAEFCRLVSVSDKMYADILHIDITFLEGEVKFDPLDPNNFSADYDVEYNEVIDVIDFWLTHPKVRHIEFRWKLTPFLLGSLKRINKNSQSLAELVSRLGTL